MMCTSLAPNRTATRAESARCFAAEHRHLFIQEIEDGGIHLGILIGLHQIDTGKNSLAGKHQPMIHLECSESSASRPAADEDSVEAFIRHEVRNGIGGPMRVLATKWTPWALSASTSSLTICFGRRNSGMP